MRGRGGLLFNQAKAGDTNIMIDYSEVYLHDGETIVELCSRTTSPGQQEDETCSSHESHHERPGEPTLPDWLRAIVW